MNGTMIVSPSGSQNLSASRGVLLTKSTKIAIAIIRAEYLGVPASAEVLAAGRNDKTFVSLIGSKVAQARLRLGRLYRCYLAVLRDRFS